jgi:anti-anti-sigma regulatory factor
VIEIRCHSEPDALVVEIEGDLVETATPLLRSCVDAAFDAGMCNLVVDLGAVRRMDRPVAQMLLDLDESLRARGGSLSVRNLDACIDHVAATAT